MLIIYVHFYYYLLKYFLSFFAISLTCAQSSEASVQNGVYPFSTMKMVKGSNANVYDVLNYKEEDEIQSDTFYFALPFNCTIYS